MMRYYFDLRDGNELAPDEEGIELWSRERVEEEATKSLADFAGMLFVSIWAAADLRAELRLRFGRITARCFKRGSPSK